MKKAFLPLLFGLSLASGLPAAPLQPVERTVGKLHISIDPRQELLAAVLSQSNTFDLFDRSSAYSQEMMEYFKPFAWQQAVLLTNELNPTFNADAPVTFMLHLPQPGELKEVTPFSDYLKRRAGGGDRLEQYRKAIEQFAETSNFEAFWNSRIPYYNQVLNRTIACMEGIDFVKTLEAYFNETQDNYELVITPAFQKGSGKGPRITDAEGKEHAYACLAPTAEQDGIVYIEEPGFIIWHEFGHSFVDPVTDRYRERVRAVNTLFEPVEKWMTSGGYTGWMTVVNETILRATTIRLFDLHLGVQRSKELLDTELRRRFIYIEPLVEKLKTFEQQRDATGIAFSAFYPQLIDVLDSLQKAEHWKRFDQSFQGPLPLVANGKPVIVYPTRDSGANDLQAVQDYMAQFPPEALLADTAALKTDLSDYGIFVFGTVESNLFLQKYASMLPFKVENQTLYADKAYTDKRIRMITGIPNPQNPDNGMMIFTALSNAAIPNIFESLNAVYKVGDDYILFIDSGNVLGHGAYKKEGGQWTF